jgi:hypothetical protein
VGKINYQLGVEWFRSFDGDEADTIDAVARTADGYLVSGFSSSLASNLPEDDTQIWAMKLAMEGSADLSAHSGMRSRFAAPGVRDSTADDAIVPGGVVSIDEPLIVTDALPHSTVTPIVDLLTTPNDLCITRLTRSGRESSLDACDPIPVPEPGSTLMLVTGVALLAVLKRRRGRREDCS